ncbi:DEAD/DEAH box helicase [Candidatus Berkiella cookevillensis]|uniref:ATP-dependent helicase HepA n=1 Tax=Candidatus Berkiella cookevillensis TaxID=437022 RepID=A0A0Q9YDS6_9GAMM|nr:DEAD/DEAH box helicase [Candidatus Berkiella cookevillensis]MCS5709111.1 DEAD/DEAH box helicase [Candidatus Berkiella cookevillensis]
MSSNQLFLSDIRSYFSSVVYEKGKKYFLQQRVSDLEIVSDDDITRVHSTVQGKELYKTRIDVTKKSYKLHLFSTCSCPVQYNCKHAVATLLMCIKNQAQTRSMTRALLPNVQMPKDPKLTTWLEQIRNACAKETKQSIESQIDKSYSLFYLLKPSQYPPASLKVELILIRQLKAGGLGATKYFSNTANSQRRHLLLVDKELIVKLEIGQRLAKERHSIMGCDYVLKGEYAEQLLPEILATERCYWDSVKGNALKMGGEIQGHFQWQIDNEGLQSLQPKIEERACHFFSIDNLWYLDKKKNEIGCLALNVNKRVASLLLEAPKISPEYIKEVSDFFDNEPVTAGIAKPKIFKSTRTQKIKPVPCMRLFQGNVSLPGNYKTGWESVALEHPMAEISFDYQGTKIKLGDKRDVFHHLENDNIIRWRRDKNAEKKALEQLNSEDLVLVDDASYYNSEHKYNFLIGYECKNPAYFSINTIPELRAKGWHIEIAENYPYQLEENEIEDWYSLIEEESNHDWFGLELGIIINGEKINLLPIIKDLLQKWQINGHMNVQEAEQVVVKLPNGRYLQLPTDRVRQILNVLVELYDRESLNDAAQLRLSRLHAARLVELEKAWGAAQLRWIGGERLKQLADKLTHFKGIKSVPLPKTFKGELRPYQQEGLNWLQFLREYELGGILADDMGLGKTIQALAHLVVEKESGRLKGPSLVIAPTSLMFNWQMEAQRFAPNLKVLVSHGPDRIKHFSDLNQYDVILTTYTLLSYDKTTLLEQSFYFLILDEAQFIKNAKNLTAQIALQINAKYRICLTGTPMENHLGELWSLFHFMLPGVLGEEKHFKSIFRTPIEKHGDEVRRAHLKNRIAPFILRRNKEEVALDLPEKIEILQHVELEGWQRDLYETIRVTMRSKVQKEIAKLGLARSHIFILEALLKLRQACCDPRLIKGALASSKKQNKSAKLSLLMNMISELLQEGRRILLFSQFTEMLALIEQALLKEKIAYVKLTGQTRDRATPVQQFQSGEVPLFLISLKAGGTGLNLTAADTVIHYDPWWNPAVENQATDRAHRIGQDKTVFVYKLIAKSTVEEKILNMQSQKHALMQGVLSSNKGAAKVGFTEEDFQALFEPF